MRPINVTGTDALVLYYPEPVMWEEQQEYDWLGWASDDSLGAWWYWPKHGLAKDWHEPRRRLS